MLGVNDLPNLVQTSANAHEALIDTSFKKKGKDYRQGIFAINANPTGNLEDRDLEWGGIGEFENWPEGEVASQDEQEEGYEKNFIQVSYAKQVSLGRLGQHFMMNNANRTQKAAKDIGAMGYKLQQKSPFSILNYAYNAANDYMTARNGSTVSALLPDSKNLASTAHKCAPYNSTTFSNVLTSNNALSPATIELMIENIAAQKDGDGEYLDIGVNGFLLLVPFEKFNDALRYLKSDKVAEVADNDKNPLNINGMPIELRYIPKFLWKPEDESAADISATACVLIDKALVQEWETIKVKVEMPFTSDTYFQDDSKTLFVRGQEMFAQGAKSSGRGMCFTQGTGTGAYTS